jgi:perosamine synthetase
VEWIPVAQPDLSGNESRYLQQCVESGWISGSGPYVDRFEADFARFCGVREAISCNSGTAALHLAMAALGIGPGDEVIVPTLTYIATVNAVRYCGATPVFADSEAHTMNLDPGDVQRKITARTKAIVAVHLFGQCAAMDQLLDLAEEKSIPLIEDAAEAHGATHRGRRAGSMGTVAAFSFFGNKIVTTGEGGMLTLDDPELAELIRLLRNQAAEPRRPYWHARVGFNYRMTNLQAAVGVAQMERIHEMLDGRARVAAWYDEALSGLDDYVKGPEIRPGNDHAFWMYTILLRPTVAKLRNEVVRLLAADGVEVRPVFSPVHLMPPYRHLGARFPVAENLSAYGISLPTYSQLKEKQIRYIASRLRAHLQSPVEVRSG